jgi:hypothetical protein
MIYSPESIDFTHLAFLDPMTLQSGSYFAPLTYKSQPFYIHAPKCIANQHETKPILDLDITNTSFVTWMDDLDDAIQLETLKHSDAWFVNAIELDDIQSAYIPAVKRARGRAVVRCACDDMKVYNEEKQLIHDTIKEKSILSILEIKGLKFTEKCFQLVVHGIQAMILNPPLLTFNTCLIKT